MLAVAAQADDTATTITLLVAALIGVAVGLSLLTVWYWRFTDPKRLASATEKSNADSSPGDAAGKRPNSGVPDSEVPDSLGSSKGSAAVIGSNGVSPEGSSTDRANPVAGADSGVSSADLVDLTPEAATSSVANFPEGSDRGVSDSLDQPQQQNSSKYEHQSPEFSEQIALNNGSESVASSVNSNDEQAEVASANGVFKTLSSDDWQAIAATVLEKYESLDQ